MGQSKTSNIATEPKDLARRARLRYVTADDAGYSRRRNGHGFVYMNSRGAALRDPRRIERIERLAIPPAWRDVWICPVAKGHLQATGFDDRNRKQYLYHERWHEFANLDKFRRFSQIGRLLPKLRRAMTNDLRGKKLTRERVLAGMVAVLDATSIRAGNEEYVKVNNSYGLTTLRCRHVSISRGRAELRFNGKGGLRREATVDDRRLVRLLKQCSQLAGAHLFQYVNGDGAPSAASAADVNAYLQERTGHPFTAKDFRTWKASALVAGIFFDRRDVETLAKRKNIANEAIAAAAELLGNTTTICRKYYVHPGLVESYQDGTLAEWFTRFTPKRRNLLSRDEVVLVRFLKKWT